MGYDLTNILNVKISHIYIDDSGYCKNYEIQKK